MRWFIAEGTYIQRGLTGMVRWLSVSENRFSSQTLVEMTPESGQGIGIRNFSNQPCLFFQPQKIGGICGYRMWWGIEILTCELSLSSKASAAFNYSYFIWSTAEPRTPCPSGLFSCLPRPKGRGVNDYMNYLVLHSCLAAPTIYDLICPSFLATILFNFKCEGWMQLTKRFVET